MRTLKEAARRARRLRRARARRIRRVRRHVARQAELRVAGGGEEIQLAALAAEDRCHLNGLAMEDGVPRYVTAVSKSNTVDGWRDRRSDGGIVVDVRSGEIVIGGLSMPHSPRLHRGKLWVLNSGTGEIGWIERGSSAEGATFHVLAFCPGFVRGLAFHGKHAFVGLSKPRYDRFEGLALDRKLAEARAADVERVAERTQHVADPAGRRGLLVQDDQNGQQAGQE